MNLLTARTHAARLAMASLLALTAAACASASGGNGTNTAALGADIQASGDKPDTGPVDISTTGKACTKTSECGADEDCNSADGKTATCVKRAYPKGAGELCGANVCGDGLDCPNVESGVALCTATCASDLDCPVATTCHTAKDGSSDCRTRKFCAPCATDEQCGPGNLCIPMGGDDPTKFCSTPCNKGGSECPPFAACQDIGDGNYACRHKNGTCNGDGSVCAACVSGSGSCAGGGACLTHPGTGESFCSIPCGAGDTCGAGFDCMDVGVKAEDGKTAVKQCLPTKVSCVKSLTQVFNKPNKDVLPDYAFVGYYDTNGNLDLTDEEPQLLHLSDFANGGKYGGTNKVILFTISAGWCGYCKEETAGFKGAMKTLKQKGIVIFQVLYDDDKTAPPEIPPTLSFLMKKWIKPLKAQSAVVIDPDQQVIQLVSPDNTYNTVAPPVNFVIDANSRLILDRHPGEPLEGVDAYVSGVMKKAGIE
jgi:thiol-disulfide isomerase/thioredoxin